MHSTLSSKTSLYMMSYSKQIGWVTLDMAAAKRLRENPEQFVARYGKYFVGGYALGCESNARITVTSENEYVKKKVDAAASASYADIVSVSGKFSSALEHTTGFESMETSVYNVGGTAPTDVTIKDIGTKIVDAMDDGTACTVETAVVTRVVIKSWLSLQAVAEVNFNKKAEELLQPSCAGRQLYLERFDALHGKTVVLLNKAEKCHRNVYACITRQWDEPLEHRAALFETAADSLRLLRHTLESMDEKNLCDHDNLLKFETKLQDIIGKWLMPAEALSAFTFHFYGAVASSHDHWSTRKGTHFSNVELTVDPNRMNVNQKIWMKAEPRLDNGHGNCRHYFGTFYAYYQAGKLNVYQKWHHRCHAHDHTTSTQTFLPGGSQSAQEQWDAVRAEYHFTVSYENRTGSERRLLVLV